MPPTELLFFCPLMASGRPPCSPILVIDVATRRRRMGWGAPQQCWPPPAPELSSLPRPPQLVSQTTCLPWTPPPSPLRASVNQNWVRSPACLKPFRGSPWPSWREESRCLPEPSPAVSLSPALTWHLHFLLQYHRTRQCFLNSVDCCLYASASLLPDLFA